ncbi:hypothetical protein CP963_14160 [Arcobacter cloacae]|uniref:Uncharacterized protein n=1 Tax=Arcobacter cloacae TaxID=1054034 RepID=A0AA94JTQ9_9BACT|nr:hypothetical protein CP963_14160 [Arcobacter cloacae]
MSQRQDDDSSALSSADSDVYNRHASKGELVWSITPQCRKLLMDLISLFMTIDAKLKLGQNVKNQEILYSIEQLSEITKYMSTTCLLYTTPSPRRTPK